jgi:nucleoside-diphosphate-sugar epimerase
MKIFITGYESFIGKELRKHCETRGIQTSGCDVAASDAAGCHRLDIRAPGIADVIPEQADAIIHLAAISRDKDCREDTINAFDANVNGTLNLMRAAKARGVKQFVFASSEWVYGTIQPGVVQMEDDPIDITKMNSEYAMTKIIGERLLFVAHQRGSCPATVLRFGIVYGPRPKPQSAPEGLFQEVRTLDTVEIKGSLSSGRRFIHVSDISDGILSALGRTGFEIFNLGGNRVITFGEIIKEAAALLNRSPKVIETDPKAINLRNPDNQKARKAFNWEPKMDIKAGLATLPRS